MFSKVAKIISNAVWTLIDLFQNSTKVNNFLGYFWERICCQELSKIEQSGHTAGPITTPKIYLRGLEAARSLQGPDLGRELVGKRRTESRNHGNISITLPNLLWTSIFCSVRTQHHGNISMMHYLTYFELECFVLLDPSPLSLSLSLSLSFSSINNFWDVLLDW